MGSEGNMAKLTASTTPVGFISKAEAYRVGAQLLARELKDVGGWAGDPTRYLYYHSIELYLKAALVLAGRTESQLRLLNHRFVKLGKECNAIGLGLSERDDIRVLELIDLQNNYIRSRYHQVGGFTVATVQALDRTAHELALLAVQIVRRAGVQMRDPKPALPFKYKFQTG